MENTGSGAVVPFDAGWEDVGSWDAVWASEAADGCGNVVEGDVIAESTTNSLIRSEDRLVAAYGVSDLIIVETKDAVLVTRRGETEHVKDLVKELATLERIERLARTRVYRPWGFYECVHSGTRYQVKSLTVHPGHSLSLQMHHHRAEHWVVVSGTARVRRGDETFLVTENESTYIPVAEVHSLENPGAIPLEVVEVQSGSYLAENDIFRFQDRYGRLEGGVG
jgi:mannose-1-phosphate guanylyltransferase